MKSAPVYPGCLQSDPADQGQPHSTPVCPQIHQCKASTGYASRTYCVRLETSRNWASLISVIHGNRILHHVGLVKQGPLGIS